jgi:predicted ArsR family transcriptional regulator
MGEDELDRRIRSIGALGEPVRRALYRYVVARDGPVSRDAAAGGVGVARHIAKFHLDRLVADGLLEARFQRLSGRTGPGAGRPAKLYQRAATEVAVSLPDRRYDLAGRLMAAAIDGSARSGAPVLEELREAAARHGAELGARARSIPAATELDGGGGDEPAGAREGLDGRDDRPVENADRLGELEDPPVENGDLRVEHGDSPGATVLERACAVLREQGYEPRLTGDRIELANCPFHALAVEHTQLVCGMNLALLDALSRAMGTGELDDGGALTAHLEPAPGRCCVVLTAT